MTNKVKVRVLNAVVDGKERGSELEISKASAENLVRIGYVELVNEAKVEKESSENTESAPVEKTVKSKPKSRKE